MVYSWEGEIFPTNGDNLSPVDDYEQAFAYIIHNGIGDNLLNKQFKSLVTKYIKFIHPYHMICT